MSNGEEPGAAGTGRWQAADGAAGRRSGSGEPVTKWVEETRRYRRPLGGWWWLALLLIPAVLALLGATMGDDEDADGKTSTANSSTMGPVAGSSGTTSGESASSSTASGTGGQSAGGSDPAGGQLASGVFAVARTGDTVAVTAEVPDEAAKTALVDAVKVGVPDATIDDSKVEIVGGAIAPAAAAIGATVSALAALGGDFGIGYDLKRLTVTGKATSDDLKQSAVDAITKAWPAGTNPELGISVGDDAAAACGTLEEQISVALASTKITFPRGGTDVGEGSKGVLDTVAGLVKGCADAKLTITGYTDASGDRAGNQRISEARAKSVLDYLSGAGVPAAAMTAVGKGDADPVAPNDTAAGIAANRRVQITVG